MADNRLHSIGLSQTSGEGFVAFCTCGWASSQMLTAALAYAEGDHHSFGRPDHQRPNESPEGTP